MFAQWRLAQFHLMCLSETVRRLLQLVIELRKDVEILYRLVALSSPLPAATIDEVRQEVEREIQPLRQTAEQTPDDKLLEFLRNFEGTVQ